MSWVGWITEVNDEYVVSDADRTELHSSQLELLNQSEYIRDKVVFPLLHRGLRCLWSVFLFFRLFFEIRPVSSIMLMIFPFYDFIL